MVAEILTPHWSEGSLIVANNQPCVLKKLTLGAKTPHSWAWSLEQRRSWFVAGSPSCGTTSLAAWEM